MGRDDPQVGEREVTEEGRDSDLAYQKIVALRTLLRLCKSKAEVDDCLSILKDLSDYVRLPEK